MQNSGGPDQMPHYVASDLGLHFLPNTPLGVSSIKRVKVFYSLVAIVAVGVRGPLYLGHNI